MSKTTSCFVKFFRQGSFTADTDLQPTTTLDPAQIVVPDWAYAFEFYTQDSVTVDDEVYTQPLQSVSKQYYPGAKLRSYEDVVAADHPDENILRDNMRINEWSHVLVTRHGWTLPYYPDQMDILP